MMRARTFIAAILLLAGCLASEHEALRSFFGGQPPKPRPAQDSPSSAAPKEEGCGRNCPHIPDPAAPPIACYDLERMINENGGPCALELQQGCDTAPPDAGTRIPGDCPCCDLLQEARDAWTSAKCGEPRIVN